MTESAAKSKEDSPRGEWDSLFDRFFRETLVPPLWRLSRQEIASEATLWGILVHTLTDLDVLLRDTECVAEIAECGAQYSSPPSVANVRMAVRFCPPLRQLMETFIDTETSSFYLSHIEAEDETTQGAASAAFAFLSGWSADINTVPGDVELSVNFWVKLFSVLFRCAHVSPTDSDALQRALFTNRTVDVGVFHSTVDLLRFATTYSGNGSTTVSMAHPQQVNVMQDIADVQIYIAKSESGNCDLDTELRRVTELHQYMERMRNRWSDYHQESTHRVHKIVERIVFICEYGNWSEWLQVSLRACCDRATPPVAGEPQEASGEMSSSDEILKSIEQVTQDVEALSGFLNEQVNARMAHALK